jgi:hypothetical protein
VNVIWQFVEMGCCLFNRPHERSPDRATLYPDDYVGKVSCETLQIVGIRKRP